MPVPRSRDKRSSEDDIEAESLILHRLSTDGPGRVRLQTAGANLPARVTDAYDDLDGEYHIDDDDDREGSRLEKLPPRGTLESSNTSTHIDKTGRPAWFRGMLQGDLPLPGLNARDAGMSASSAQRSRKRRARCVRLSMLAGGAALVIGAFVFALGPKFGVDVKKSKWYEYMGDKWHGDKDAPNPGTNTGALGFNKPVGYPGFYTTGLPPDFAEHMTQTPSPTIGSSPIQTAIPGFQDPNFKPFEHMGPLTPYLSSSGWGIDDHKYAGTPMRSASQTCTLQQVHMLHRHGARYPTAGGPPDTLRDFLKANSKLSFSGRLAFLNQYRFSVGEELLTPIGRSQLYDSGVKAALLYGQLVDQDARAGKTLFARAGSQQRIVDSGLAWLNGFFGAEWSNHTSFEIQIEAPGFNTTTAPEFACPAWSKPGMSPGGEMANQWAHNYLQDAILRLQTDFGGAALTSELLFGMQQMCSYDTVAFGSSNFCGLFTKQEWLDYEYAWDLKFMNTNGATSPLGKAYGLGWVNELISRLERQPWDPNTQTSENATLNLNPATFPLDRRFYIDFTHDSTITSVLAALNLPQFDETLAVSNPNRGQRQFVTSKVVPFAARLSIERWNCDDASNTSSNSGTDWIRMKLNDAVLPLSQYKACAQESRPDGLCRLTHFLESQQPRNSLGWWDKCL